MKNKIVVVVSLLTLLNIMSFDQQTVNKTQVEVSSIKRD